MAHHLYKYSTLTKLTTNYAQKMKRLSDMIFGEVARPTNSKSMKVVKLYSVEPYYKNKNYIDYYPRHIETGMLMWKLRGYGLFRDEHRDFTEEMIRLRALRGKVNKRGKKKAVSKFL